MDAQSQPRSKVLLVGHCGFDAAGLVRAVEEALPEASVRGVDRPEQAEASAGSDTLVLVNRVLPGGGGGSGVALIQKLLARADDRRPAAMLVSNYPEAQRDAEAVGALPGFGKNALGTPDTTRKLRQAAGHGATAARVGHDDAAPR